MKRLLSFLLCVTVALSAFFCIPASAAYDTSMQELNLNSECLLLISADNGEIIFEKDIRKQTAPASLTKIVTAIVVIENCKNLNEVVTVPEECIKELSGTGSSVANLRTGEQITVYDLLCYMMIMSANDAATTLANYVTGGDRPAFIAKMNEVASRLGYDLSEEDGAKVYEAFQAIADKKEKVGAKELDAIVAAAAMQVPPTYVLDSYVVTSGNTISATAHLKLHKQDKVLEGVSIGDGAIDAAFLAIEQITGQHYELDDFQIQAVTEGREAMGQTVVKLRSGGKVYSGRGISTDIVGAGIRAYINALNKIVYEEDNA